MLKRLKLYFINKKIERLEEYEIELNNQLMLLRSKVLPQLRGRRNTLMFAPSPMRKVGAK